MSNLPRSPNDATRFTATGPHVSKPSSSGSFASNSPPNGAATTSSGTRINFGQAPPNESAQQKIARLRAAAAAARRGKESNFDVAVRVGRVWADRAHKVTVYSLIGFSIISGVVATAGITDMIMFNRRRRNEWLAEQQRKHAIETAQAKAALAEGRATEDQILLINRERAAAAAAEEKKNRPGIFKRAGNYLFGGLQKEEQKGGRLGASATAKIEERVQPAKKEILAENVNSGVLKAVEENVQSHRRVGEEIEQVARPLGGPLDRQAQQAASALSAKGQSWSNWIMGR